MARTAETKDKQATPADTSTNYGKVIDVTTGEAIDAPPPQNIFHPHGARVWQLAGNDIRGYRGVDPEYQNYADPVDAPLMTDAEKEQYEERLRLHRVASGTEEPADDDLVIYEGNAVRYGDVKDLDEAQKADVPANKQAPKSTQSTPAVVKPTGDIDDDRL